MINLSQPYLKLEDFPRKEWQPNVNNDDLEFLGADGVCADLIFNLMISKRKVTAFNFGNKTIDSTQEFVNFLSAPSRGHRRLSAFCLILEKTSRPHKLYDELHFASN